MILELTDTKRYELEFNNVVSVILAANRSGTEITEVELAQTLNIDQATTDKLILKLQTDNVIK
jgi:transcription initiation factor IIE alpha subunit